MLDDVWVVEALKFLPHYPLSLSPHVSESKKKAKHVPRKLPATADHITVTRCVLVAGDCGG